MKNDIREAKVEEELYHLFKTVLKQHDFEINNVKFKDIEPQYPVDGGWADLVLLLDDGRPLLVIECKRKIAEAKGWRAIRDFDPLGSGVIGQSREYAVNLGSPAFATTNGRVFALFKSPELGMPFKLDTHRLLVNEISLVEKDVEEILQFITKWHSHVPVPLVGIDWLFISRLRSFVSFLSRQFEPTVGRLEKNAVFSRKIEELRERIGDVSTSQLARETAYLLMNKLVFYKILERHYHELPKLGGVSAPDGTAFVEVLRKYFDKAIKVTKDFEPVFVTGIFGEIPLPDVEYVYEEVNGFIEDMDIYKLEEVGSDVVGYIYEELLPAEERHRLGQFYTPPPIAELITKWVVNDFNDIVLDPAVGSGTFLVKAYKRLADLKLAHNKRKRRKKRPGALHKEILSQLYADDINPFPLQLTAMNLAMRDVRYPTSEMNLVEEDFFNLLPKQRILVPYTIKTAAGELQRRITIPEVDGVVANPPYTRWGEIPEKTKRAILKAIGDELKEYGLTGGIGKETAIYVHFIMHAHNFMRIGGKLGMIISSSWLQADYGIGLANFLLDNFNVKAVIDFNQRLFRIPLVATCVLLVEKKSPGSDASRKKTVMIYVDGETEVERILSAIKYPKRSKVPFLVNVVYQSELPRDEKWIKVMFKTVEIEKAIRESPHIIKAKDIFKTRRGNIEGTSRGSGADSFFYLPQDDVRKWGLERFVKPMLVSPRYARSFTFTGDDWGALKNDGKPCYIFLAHKRRQQLPENVLEYVKWGERTPLVKSKKSGQKGKTANKSLASLARQKNRRSFYGWYDLGGLKPAQIFFVRRAWRKARFILTDFPMGIDEGAFLTFMPRSDVRLTKQQLKALLAYLNSSITQLLVETLGISAGGGASGLDTTTADNLPILDVVNLPKGIVRNLAKLFDNLERKARQTGGVATKKNLEKVQTEIDSIDETIVDLLQLDLTASEVKDRVEKLTGRRLARAHKPKPEVITGEEVPRISPPKRRGRRRKSEKPTTPLTEWL